MPRLSVNVSVATLDLIQKVCAQYGVTQQEFVGVMLDPRQIVLTPGQEDRLKELGKERRTPPEVKKAVEALSALSDEQIAAILEARSSESKQDGRDNQG